MAPPLCGVLTAPYCPTDAAAVDGKCILCPGCTSFRSQSEIRSGNTHLLSIDCVTVGGTLMRKMHLVVQKDFGIYCRLIDVLVRTRQRIHENDDVGEAKNTEIRRLRTELEETQSHSRRQEEVFKQRIAYLQEEVAEVRREESGRKEALERRENQMRETAEAATNTFHRIKEEIVSAYVIVVGRVWRRILTAAVHARPQTAMQRTQSGLHMEME